MINEKLFSKLEIDKKKAYMTMILLLDDIFIPTEQIQKVSNDAKGLITYYRNFRYLIIALSNLHDSLKRFEVTLAQSGFKSSSIKDLKKDLLFIKHIRNKGVAHLDSDLIEKAIQWTPNSFDKAIKGNVEASTIYANLAILELAINSYVDDNGDPKMFDSVIDFVYPPDFKEITNFMLSISQKSLDYLAPRLDYLENAITYYSPEDMMFTSTIAGKTDFDLNTNVDYSFDKESTLATMQNGIQKMLGIVECEKERKRLSDFCEIHMVEKLKAMPDLDDKN